MLADKQVLTTLAVHDVKVAARFYEGVLGLERIESMGRTATSSPWPAGDLRVIRGSWFVVRIHKRTSVSS